MPAAHLLIRLTPDGAAEWLALSRDGRVLAGPQAGWPAGGAERVDVIVPAQDVLLLRAPRVARQRRQLEQALPFAIEEHLAAPVETLHVAAADGDAGDQLTVAVVAQARLDGWLAALRGAGLEPDRMVPESWLLAADPATVLIDGARAVLRYADAGALAGAVDEMPAWFDLLARDGRLPATLHVVAAPGVDLPPSVARAIDHASDAAPDRVQASDRGADASRAQAADGGASDHGAGASRRPAANGGAFDTATPATGAAAALARARIRLVGRENLDAPLRWFAARLPRAGGLNLLQGRHAPRRGREGAQRLWRRAAALAAIALGAVFAQLALEREQLQARRDEQRVEMERLLRSALPSVARIVDPKAQLAAEFARGGSGEGQGALPLLARVAPLIAGSGRYTLDAIEFRADALEITLRTADVASLDSLRESLAALPSLQVEVTGANPGSGGIEGRLRIRSRA